MSFNTFDPAFLAEANSQQVLAYLTNDATALAAGLQAMTWLLANRPALANEVLCLIYDVACYPVEHVFPEHTAACGKWFASVLAESAMADIEVPLAETEAGIHAAAVTALGLREKFFAAECTASV